jgi:microcystin-dependent protein
MGTGSGLSNVQLGQMGGTPNTTLTLANLPAHSHPLTVEVEVSSANAGSDEAAGGFLTTTSNNFYATSGGGGHLGGPNGTSGVAGGNVPFSNESPYLGLNYLMAIEGIYPSRS